MATPAKSNNSVTVVVARLPSLRARQRSMLIEGALVAAALGWRTNLPPREHAITMLTDGLLPLYGHDLADHIQPRESLRKA